MTNKAREHFLKATKEEIAQCLSLPRIFWDRYFLADKENRKAFMDSDSAFVEHQKLLVMFADESEVYRLLP